MAITTSSQRLDIRAALERAKAHEALTREDSVLVMDCLERHECWTPLFRLINARIAKPGTRHQSDYTRMARCQIQYLEDVFAAAQTCARMLREIPCGYGEFRDQVIERVLEPEDWSAESVILQSIIDLLPNQVDQIACQERLCLLFEKKIPNDTQLADAYERLLALSPTSSKALRYFKMVFAQEGDWNRVVQVLRSMHHAASHPQESFRVAQEIATTLLYQLDQPREALAVLDEHCADSPLDTSTIQYDAHHRLRDWNGCLNVLRQSQLNADSDAERAALHFRSGEIADLMGNTPLALEHFQKSTALMPSLLDAHEKIVNTRLAAKEWPKLVEALNGLRAATKDDALRAGLQEVIQRVEEGSRNAR